MAIPHDETYNAADVGHQHSAGREAGGRTTLALISGARQALAEARNLPDIRRVMEAASTSTWPPSGAARTSMRWRRWPPSCVLRSRRARRWLAPLRGRDVGQRVDSSIPDH